MPRVISAEVPSGKTSQSLTDSEAAGASALTRSRTRGWPTTALALRGPVPGQRAGVVLALVAGQPPRQVAGAVDPGRGADVGLDRQRARPVEVDVVDAGAGRAATASLTQRPSCRSRSGSGTVEVRTKTSTRSVELVAPRAAQPAVPPRDHLDVEVDPRARAWRSPGRRAPTARPAAGTAYPAAAERLDGAEGVVAVAVGPAGHDHRRALRSGRSRAVARPDRPVPPVRPVAVLAQPGQHPRLVGLQAPLPLLAPVRRPTPRAREAARTSASCSGSSRRGRPAAARRRASARRRSTGRRWRRSRRSPSAPAAARRRSGAS